MARVLFLTEEEITSTTILSGSVDPDFYVHVVEDVQDIQLQELLGTELYDKMYNYQRDEIDPTGLYLELRDSYIKPYVKHLSLSNYIMLANYNVKSGGVYKNTGENKEVVSKEEVDGIKSYYQDKANVYKDRFDKWIGLNGSNIPEYKTTQDEVDATDQNFNNTLWI